jgi:hypothetical protein
MSDATVTSNTSQKIKRLFNHLENVDFAAGPVDVELGLLRLVGVDALAGQEVDDVVLAIAVAVGRRDLHVGAQIQD